MRWGIRNGAHCVFIAATHTPATTRTGTARRRARPPRTRTCTLPPVAAEEGVRQVLGRVQLGG